MLSRKLVSVVNSKAVMSMKRNRQFSLDRNVPPTNSSEEPPISVGLLFGIVGITATAFVGIKDGYCVYKLRSIQNQDAFLTNSIFALDHSSLNHKNPTLFERSEVIKSLHTQQVEHTSRYTLLYGEKGQGKSFLTDKIAISTPGFMKVSLGTSIRSNQPNEYANTWRTAVGTSDPQIVNNLVHSLILPSVWSKFISLPKVHEISVESNIKQSYETIEAAAKHCKEKNGQVPVLIVDQVDLLVTTESGRKLLRDLQLHAKDWAAKEILKVILVARDGKTIQFLQSDPSHMQYMRLRDLTRLEAVEFLKSQLPESLLYRTDERDVQRVIDELTDGRIGLLQELAVAIENNNIAEFERMVLSRVELQWRKVGLFHKKQEESVVQIGSILLKKIGSDKKKTSDGFVPLSEVVMNSTTRATPNNIDTVTASLNMLVINNVLSMRYEDNSIGFASRAHKTVFQKRINELNAAKK